MSTKFGALVVLTEVVTPTKYGFTIINEVFQAERWKNVFFL